MDEKAEVAKIFTLTALGVAAVTLPDSWILLLGALLAFAAVLIRSVRWLTRRDDPRYARLPPDLP
jgi:hypothetical protein